jgi:hypothetical protein
MYRSDNLIYGILQFYAPNVVVTSKEGRCAKVGHALIILTGNVGKSGTRSG